MTDQAPSIPPPIIAAILHVKAHVGAVAKSQRNSHGGYQFASTDDIYAAVMRLMAEAGLVIMPLEVVPPEIVKNDKDGKTSQWGKFTFGFILATKDASWTDAALRRTLFIQITGPQSFQAAESYAVKQFMRSLFKLPTGDMDLDSVAQAETVEAQEALNGGRKRKTSAESKRDGTKEAFEGLRRGVADVKTSHELRQFREANAETIATLPPRWGEFLDAEIEDKFIAVSGNGA